MNSISNIFIILELKPIKFAGANRGQHWPNILQYQVEMGFENSPRCTSILNNQRAAIKLKKTHKVKAVYIKRGRWTIGRAWPIQNLDPQALTRGLLQALRGIVYRELWVGWIRLVLSVQRRGRCMLLGCSRVALKGPTLVLCNNWGVRQLSCMTS